MEQIQMDAMGVQFPYFILISKALQHALDCKHVSSPTEVEGTTHMLKIKCFAELGAYS